MTFQPLTGVRVLDLTSVVVGPAATWRLAQYGADVIKVESPAGDLMRGLGGQSPSGQHSGAYLHLNRGKRNICLDLKSPQASRIIKRLVEAADVIVCNMRPQALVRLGLDPDTIRSRHPDKIYCMLTGYGTDGPYAGLPTYDSVVQGVSGIAGLTMARDGMPAYVPLLVCDHVVGEIAAGSILAAILEWRRTGTGCLVEVPMFETMATFVLQEHLAQASFNPPVGPAGDQRLLNAHNKPVPTSDGFVSLTINTDQQVRSYLVVTGRPELADDPRFNSVSARATHVREWFAVRGAPLTDKTTEQWLTVFRAADIAAMPCHTLDTLTQDPHLQAVGLLEDQLHPVEGKTLAVRSSVRVDGARQSVGAPAAPLGWDTRAILKEIGFTSAEIDSFNDDGTVTHFEAGHDSDNSPHRDRRYGVI